MTDQPVPEVSTERLQLVTEAAQRLQREFAGTENLLIDIAVQRPQPWTEDVVREVRDDIRTRVQAVLTSLEPTEAAGS